MKNRIIILLGSNIDKEKNLPAAVEYLKEWSHVRAISSVIETCPVGLIDQPTFLNAAASVESSLDPAVFRRDVLDRVESKLNRTRTSDKNAPRTIDADMILFNQDVFDLDKEHHIPDPDLLKYLHVIVPIAELEPDLIHPETGESLSAIANRLVEAAKKMSGDPLKRRPDIDLLVG
ncbi:MAG: 2-amino-4-hydroxy-6-hydroxymethyldihydropteridine diphosphokinase [Candidatus Promineifilaceae bacterium]